MSAAYSGVPGFIPSLNAVTRSAIVIASARSYLNALNKLHSGQDKVKAQGDV